MYKIKEDALKAKKQLLQKPSVEILKELEYLRVSQAIRYIPVGKSTIWLWARQGKITAYKVSDRITVFKRSELDAMINANVEVA